MSDSNGEPVRDPETGQFLPGNPGGPGRPKGFDLRAIANEKAKEEGLDLRTWLWEVIQDLKERAKGKGSEANAASKILFEQLCLPPDENPALSVNVNNHLAGAAGPPVPQGAALEEWIRKLGEVVTDQAERNKDPDPHQALSTPSADDHEAAGPNQPIDTAKMLEDVRDR